MCRNIVFVALVLTKTCLAQDRIVDYPASDTPLGIGWNSSYGKPADAFCVDFERRQQYSQVVSQDTADFRVTEKLGKISNSSLEFGASVLSGPSASIKAKFTSNYSFSLEDQSYAAVMRVQNSPEEASPSLLIPLQLKSKYVDLLNDGKLQQFTLECGDAFVIRRFGGAELVALVTLHDLSEETKRGVNLVAKAGAFAFEVSNSLEAEERQSILKRTSEFSYVLTGGSGSTGAVDTAGLITLISTVPTLAQNAPHIWTIAVRSYEKLSNWPNVPMRPVKENRMALATSMHGRLSQIIAVANDALNNRTSYIEDSVYEGELENITANIRPILVDLELEIKQCVADQLKCESLPKDDTFDYYKAYSVLPLKRGANDFDKNLIRLESKKEKLIIETRVLLEKVGQAARLPTPTCAQIEQVKPRSPNHIALPPMGRPSSEFIAALDACNGLERIANEIVVLQRDEETSIKATVIQRWVRGISSEYCYVSAVHPLCLNASKLAKLESEVNSRNYGWCIVGHLPFRCSYATDENRPLLLPK